MDYAIVAFGISQMKPFHAIAIVAVLLLLSVVVIVVSD